MKNPFKSEPEVIIQKPRKKKTAKEIIESAYVNTLRKNPNLQVKIAMKESGHYEDYKEETDPIALQEREINKEITADAARLIKTDPILRKKYVDKVAEKAIAGLGNKKNGETLTPAGELIKSLREFRELKDELEDENGDRVAPSGWSSALQQMLATPEMAGVLAAIAKQILAPGSQLQSQRKYVVTIDGKLSELDENQYTEYVKLGRAKPVAMIESPKQEKKKEKEAVKTKADSENELPDWAKDLPFETLEGYLELTPEDFVTQIKSEISGGNKSLQVFWNFLMTADYDTLVKILEPYKNNSKAGKFIISLLEKREWVNGSIEIIKNTKIDMEI